MKMIRKMFEVPESYIQSVKHYSIKDAAMAMGLFILIRIVDCETSIS